MLQEARSHPQIQTSEDLKSLDPMPAEMEIFTFFCVSCILRVQLLKHGSDQGVWWQQTIHTCICMYVCIMCVYEKNFCLHCVNKYPKPIFHTWRYAENTMMANLYHLKSRNTISSPTYY